MGKKDKKKGKGAEKTALKTEKKAVNKLKKDLAAKGEVLFHISVYTFDVIPPITCINQLNFFCSVFLYNVNSFPFKLYLHLFMRKSNP